MKSKTVLLYISFIVLLVVVVLMFMPYPGQDELVTQNQAPVETQQNFNPQYGELTEDQIAVADRAIGDLLNSVEGINPSMVAVKSIEPREYSSTALNCPQSGQMYADVITPGYQIILEAQGKEYDYRLDMAEAVILCEL